MKRTLFLAAAFLCVSRAAFASVDYCRVIDVSGKAEVLESGSARWLPLSAPKFLKGGDQIRTSGKSYAEISTSADFSGLLKLGADSRLEVLGEDLARFFLEEGVLMVLREENDDSPESRPAETVLMQILTQDLSAGLLSGGCSVSVTAKGTWVRVFSESVRVTPTARKTREAVQHDLPEGFKFFSARAGKIDTLGPLRLYFSDYADWQFWVRQCYERQDARSDEGMLRKQGL